MKRGIYFSVLATFILGLVGGCAKQPSRVDKFYGASYELAKLSQINNSGADIADEPAIGLDGEIGVSVIERHGKSFEKAPPKTDSFSVSFEGMQVK